MYTGKNINRERCDRFITQECNVEINSVDADVIIEILISEKKNDEEVAKLVGFIYNYETSSFHKGEMNALHIKTLYTCEEHQRKGIATYLMEEAIKYAESRKVKHITTNPAASTTSISQEDLEKFYKKFSFAYNGLLRKQEKYIEFRIVID